MTKKQKFLDILKDTNPIRILFNCSGNIMRSAYGEIMFEKMLKDKYGKTTKILCESGGVIYNNDSIAYETKQILLEQGVPRDRIKKFRSRHIDDHPEAFKGADLILTMTKEHLPYLQHLENKTFLLNDFAFDEKTDIADPFFSGRARESFAEVKKALDQMIIIFEKEGILRK